MIRRSLAFSFTEKYAGIASNVGTMAIVSRILTPAEVGLFLVASAVVVLIETFRDFGASTCIVQEHDLTRDFVRTVFTIIAILSLTLAVVLNLAAGAIATFYGEPELEAMIRFATLSFALAPFSNPLLAVMRREMAFGLVARVNVSAAFATALTTVAFAASDFGAISFVYGTLAGAVVLLVSVLVARPDFWVFRPSLASWRRVVPFGAWSTVVTLLTLAFDFVPRLILGRSLGFAAVGLFGRSTALCQLPERYLVSALQPVVLSAMSERARSGRDIAPGYLFALAGLSAVQWPALVSLAILAEPVVLILLGSQWLEAVPLVQILALAGLFMAPVHLTYPVLVSLGHVRDMAKVILLTLPPAVLMFLVAAQYGLVAAAVSFFVTAPLQAAVGLAFVRRHARFRLSDIAGIAWRSGVVTAGAAAAPLLAYALLLRTTPLDPLGLVLAVAGSAAGWYGALHLVRHPLLDEVQRVFASLLGARKLPVANRDPDPAAARARIEDSSHPSRKAKDAETLFAPNSP